MADTITPARLTLPTNTGAEVYFDTISAVARFADLNARRVSNTLDLLLREATGCDAQLLYGLELMVDIAYQVAGAVDLLADAVNSGDLQVKEVAHG